MAIFSKKSLADDLPTHEELVEQIIEHMKTNNPKWKCFVFPKQQHLHDLLLIRTFKKKVSRSLNLASPNPISHEKEEYLQVVLPITIDIENIIDDDALIENFKDWAYAPLIVKDLRDFIRRFTQIEKENA